ETQRSLPPGCDWVEYPFLSWRAFIWPYLEQGALWDETRRAFLVNPLFTADPPHVGFSLRMRAFMCPSDDRSSALVRPEGFWPGFSSYLGVRGGGSRGGVLYFQSKTRFGDVTDGLSTTLMVGERPPAPDETGNIRFGWWYAGVGQDLFGSLDSIL